MAPRTASGGLARRCPGGVHLGHMIQRIVLLSVPAALVLDAVPFIWIFRHRGEHRRRDEEGRLDGWLLLFSVVLALFSVAMVIAAGVRTARENEILKTTQPVTASIQSCRIDELRPGREDRAYTLTCSVRYDHDGRALSEEVHAGYPSSRRDYEEWVRKHPPGTTSPLRVRPTSPPALTGFQDVAASTTTAASAARGALMFAVVSLLLFIASRLVATRRTQPRT